MQPIHRYLDAAILAPQLTRDEVLAALQAVLPLKVRTVCVRPCDLELAIEQTRDADDTEVCSVLSFPHGHALSASKADEAKRHADLGVHEIDMVANYGYARSGRWDAFEADVAAVVEAVDVTVKVIFETAQLDLATIRTMVDRCVDAGADFVKTSTGFNGEGATDQAVRAMLEAAEGRIKVKPAGGIRDRARADHLVQMGVHRLGVNWSSCPTICRPDASHAGAGTDPPPDRKMDPSTA
jgi:deoxyribose-phosphate aldolase